MSEPRFPPPGGQLGYREAAPSQPNDVEVAPKTKRRVTIVTRPDDPDEMAKLTYVPEPKRRLPVPVTFVLLVLYVVYIATCALLTPNRHDRFRTIPITTAH